MLILEVLLGLKSKQGDMLAAFLHADLGPGKHVYIKIPPGFRKPGKVLKLKKTLWSSTVTPRILEILVKKMEACGIQQSHFNPCLFIGDCIICICYVDDLLFWSWDESYIHETANRGS